MKRLVFGFILFLIFVLSGCAGTTGGRAKVFQRGATVEAFTARASQSFSFPEKVQDIAIQVKSVPSIVQLKIPMDVNMELLQLRLKEDVSFKINRTLLTGGLGDDYLIDYENKLILLNVDLPSIYFLESPLRFDLRMLLVPIEGRENKLVERNISLSFNWVPSREQINGSSGFEYYSSLKSVERERKVFLPQMQRELSMSNTDRFNQRSLQLLQDFISGN